MQSLQFFREFTEKMKEVQRKLLEYLENTEAKDDGFTNLIKHFNNIKITESKQEFKCLLHLITKISQNHQFSNGFIQKVEQILKHFAQDMQKHFTNFDIFNIFKGSKVLLLLIFTEKIATPDDRIINFLIKEKYINRYYFDYFYSEFKPFLTKDFYKRSKLIESEPISQSYEEKKLGESNQELRKLIQTDSVEKFTEYVSTNDFSIDEPIDISIFESQPFLLQYKDVSLIQFVSFYGSLNILKYLVSQNQTLLPSLWLFAIHSNNIEIIQYLEENSNKPPSNDYNACLKEAIKCHHINIMNYIKEKYIANDQKISIKCFADDLRYYNFINLSEKINKINSFDDLDEQFYVCDDKITNVFYELCKFDYLPIVEFLLKNEKFNFNAKRIFLFIVNCISD